MKRILIVLILLFTYQRTFGQENTSPELNGVYYQVFDVQGTNDKCANIVQFKADSSFRIGRMWKTSQEINWNETGTLLCVKNNFILVQIIDDKGPRDTTYSQMKVKSRTGIDTIKTVWRQVEHQNSILVDWMAVPKVLNCQTLNGSYYVKNYKARKNKKQFDYVHGWIYPGKYEFTKNSNIELFQFLKTLL